VQSLAQPEKPNIIFILTDDMDAKLVDSMPRLKSLIADQGVTFANHFVSFSLCCPSRASILRGQYAHNTQILGNMPPTGGYEKFHALGEENSTVATWLQAAGYKTMYVGKYLNGYPGNAGRTFVPPGWNEWYSAVAGSPYDEYGYTLNENGKLVSYGHAPSDYGTDVYAKKTLDFIQRMTKEGKPFFVHFSVYAPHSPYTPAPRHKEMFADAKAPQTPNFNEGDVSDKPEYIRTRPPLNAQDITRLNQDYRLRLQSLQAVDEAIAAFVDTLKASGKLENTFFFFMGDNGYHMGNHRLMTGKIAPYEEDIKVPMLVRGPGVPAGKTIDLLTGNVDLAPTWAELAGAKADTFVDGRSLLPLWTNATPSASTWRQAYLLENGDTENRRLSLDAYSASKNIDPLTLEPIELNPDQQPGRQAQPVPNFRGLRTKDYTYIEYETGEKELYDLAKDPQQLVNAILTADSALVRQLAAKLAELKRCAANSCRIIESAPLATK
jgi:arylsulfatase A-like enzyme